MGLSCITHHSSIDIPGLIPMCNTYQKLVNNYVTFVSIRSMMDKTKRKLLNIMLNECSNCFLFLLENKLKLSIIYGFNCSPTISSASGIVTDITNRTQASLPLEVRVTVH